MNQVSLDLKQVVKIRQSLVQGGSLWRVLPLGVVHLTPRAVLLRFPHPQDRLVLADHNSGLHSSLYMSEGVPHQRLGHLCQPDSGWDRSLIQGLRPVPALGLGASASYWLLLLASVRHLACPNVCCQSWNFIVTNSKRNQRKRAARHSPCGIAVAVITVAEITRHITFLILMRVISLCSAHHCYIFMAAEQIHLHPALNAFIPSKCSDYAKNAMIAVPNKKYTVLLASNRRLAPEGVGETAAPDLDDVFEVRDDVTDWTLPSATVDLTTKSPCLTDASRYRGHSNYRRRHGNGRHTEETTALTVGHQYRREYELGSLRCCCARLTGPFLTGNLTSRQDALS
jgi:hypothetical protein